MSQLRHGSAFRPFNLTMLNGASLTGIVHIPTQTATNLSSSKPLIVGIHGGTCNCHHYDMDDDYTASGLSTALGIPFVAINRPCYMDSTSLLPLPEGQSFYKETARWTHEFILPALWEAFGKPNSCSGIVTTNHSMAVPVAIIAASMYAHTVEPKYPLAGLIFSGWGIKHQDRPELQGPPGMPLPDKLTFPDQLRKLFMLSEDELQAHDPKLIEGVLKQQAPMPIEEFLDSVTQWPTYWKSYAEDVNVPIMYAMGEHDWLWHATRELVEEYASYFPKCPRFDDSVVLGAPHAIELGWASRGFYARCFGWAIEVCSRLRKS